jgi:hypothetical protein
VKPVSHNSKVMIPRQLGTGNGSLWKIMGTRAWLLLRCNLKTHARMGQMHQRLRGLCWKIILQWNKYDIFYFSGTSHLIFMT